MKKVLTTMLIVLSPFLLAGCGKEANDDDIINQVENNKQENNKNISSNENSNLNLYSDDTRIVFNMQDVYYVVFYHNGTEIIGLEYIYKYPDIETAKIAETAIKQIYTASEDVEAIDLKGTEFRIKFKKSAYEGETVESIRLAYSYLEEMKKN